MSLRGFLYSLVVVVALTFTQFASADIFNFSAVIDASQEVPANGSGATGTATITFDDITSELAWDISWSGLSGPATGIHFHNAAAGSNGPVVVNIGNISGLNSPTIGSTVIAQNIATELFAHRLYINIHSNTFPGGEIRGQVVPEPGSVAAVFLIALCGCCRWRCRRR